MVSPHVDCERVVIEWRCSNIILRVPTRLLVHQPEAKNADYVGSLACMIWVGIEFVTNRWCRIVFLSFEGASNLMHTSPRLFNELPGIIMILTVYKTFASHDRPNRTCVALPSSNSGWRTKVEHIWPSLVVLARDSVVYFVIIFGLWIRAFGD